jgi:FkbM family methyltransferase
VTGSLSSSAPSGPGWSVGALAGASLRAIARRLPAKARRTLLRCLAASASDYDTFRLLARSHGVHDIRVTGAYGMIEGSIEDDGVLRAYALTKTWAAPGNRLFVEFFDRHGGGAYVDVGANIGLTTIPVAQNRAVSCAAFEPAPENFRYLTSNLAANCPHGNVEAFNLAVFDRDAVLAFELSEHNLGDHRVHVRDGDGQWAENRRRVIEVKAVRLDAVLNRARLARPVVAKIATQGAEGHVIAGGRALLAEVEVIGLEFWPYGIARANGDVDTIAAFLAAHFRWGAIIAGGTDTPLAWRPIEAVAAQLAATAGRRDRSPHAYADVFARK